MLKKILLLVFFNLCSGVLSENHPVSSEQELAIFARYGGLCRLNASTIEELSRLPKPLIIQNQQEFEFFTKRLPTEEESKRSQLLSMRDPLTYSPRFDWDRMMMLVLFDEKSLSFFPYIARIEVQKDHLLVIAKYHDIALDPVLTKKIRPQNFGSYGAALVAKSSLPIQWHWSNK